MRVDVQHARVGERAIAARAAIGRQPEVVGVFRLDDAGVVDAEEQARAGKRGALGDQRFHQRLRFAAGLAGDDAVAGPDDAREVRVRVGSHAGDANICIRRFPGEEDARRKIPRHDIPPGPHA